MGSVFPRRKRWWIKFKLKDGRWKPKATPFLVDDPSDRSKALHLLERMEEGIRESALPDEPSRITIEKYGQRWILQRQRLRISDWTNDESKLRCHVYPEIGMLRLSEVRAIHIAALIRTIRLSKRKLAPRTVRNIYSSLRSFFRDAEIEGLVERSPCILTRYQLGDAVDADPDWRDRAIFSRAELETLISDSRVPFDRRVLYALQGIAGRWLVVRGRRDVLREAFQLCSFQLPRRCGAARRTEAKVIARSSLQFRLHRRVA
jgi:hypothetical protein